MRFMNYTYKSAEHLFQTLKCAKESDKKKIRKTTTPKQAKILGKFIETRSNWSEETKANIMRSVLQRKFEKPKLRKKLVYTGDAELVYLNYWHDTFWGVCTCTTHNHTGQNRLGITLMEIRAEEKDLDSMRRFYSLDI